MTDDSITPSLGGKRKDISGREPGLSRVHRTERTAAVAALIKDVCAPVTHRRFNAVLGLADYPDQPRAVGAILRTAQDEALMTKVAVVYALGWMGARLSDDP